MKLKEARKLKKLRQIDIGKMVGRSEQWVRDIERGAYKLSEEMYEILRKELGDFER